MRVDLLQRVALVLCAAVVCVSGRALAGTDGGAMGGEASGGGAGGVLVVYVDDDAPAGGDGLSWGTAFRFLTDGLALAASGGVPETQVRVAGGVYRADQSAANPSGSGDVEATFFVKHDVLGGYAGYGAADPDERDLVNHVTTLTGDLLGNDSAEEASRVDNTWHIVTVPAVSLVELSGVVIRNGGRTYRGAGGFDPGNGGGVFAKNSTVTLADCVFTENWARQGASVFAQQSILLVERCTFAKNQSPNGHGAGIKLQNSHTTTVIDSLFVEQYAGAGAAIGAGEGNADASLTILRSTFEKNVSDGGGSVTQGLGAWKTLVQDCAFRENAAIGGAGAILAGNPIRVLRCQFTDNNAGSAGCAGLWDVGEKAFVANCVFSRNTAEMLFGGAAYFNSDDHTVANCAFSNNSGELGGGCAITGNARVKSLLSSCSFGGNSPYGVQFDPGATGTEILLHNCLFWANTPADVGDDDGFPVGFSPFFCNIAGDWVNAADGNIHEDPLFVQMGMDDLRLSAGSPCLDTGSAALLPADALDLDGDGNVNEPLPVDLAEAARVQGDGLDMGAYEGEFEPLPPSATEGDIDPLEQVILLPQGGAFDPPSAPAVVVKNTSSEEDGSATVTMHAETPFVGAGGFHEVASVLTTEMSFEPGEAFIRVFIPLSAEQLGALELGEVDIVSLNPLLGDWALAVAGNTAPSPGHPGPVGDRIVTINSDNFWGLTPQLGDYGIYWNPKLAAGFAWANVDVPASFAVGAEICFGDGASAADPATPDSAVDELDLESLLGDWGASADRGEFFPGAFDLDDDGIIDGADLGLLLGAWGACDGAGAGGGGWATDASAADEAGSAGGGEASSRQARAPIGWGPVARGVSEKRDLDRDGVVNGRDLGLMLGAWGDAGDASTGSVRADLNLDGRVNGSDLAILLGHAAVSGAPAR